MSQTLEMFKELTEADGIAGNEHQISGLLKKYLLNYVDEIDQDKLGSLIAKKQGSGQGPRVMLAAHMDEAGFIVTEITEEGFVYFQPVGGWWSHVLLGQKVTITGRNGKIAGIIGATPSYSHDKKQVVGLQDLYIDLGVMNRDEVLGQGIRPGDMITPICECTPLVNEAFVMAKAWDDRAGCAVLSEVLRRLKDLQHPNTVYAVGTVQEEVGTRGAKCSAYKVQPDIAIVIDVANAKDTPGAAKGPVRELGKGPLVVLYDKTMLPHRGLLNYVIASAKKQGIPYQLDAFRGGGTDGGPIHTSFDGIPTIVLGLPIRYVHSHAGVLNRNDFENLVNLLVAILCDLSADTVQTIIQDPKG